VDLFARATRDAIRTPEGWRISGAGLRVVHQTGNADLLKEVAALGPAMESAGPGRATVDPGTNRAAVGAETAHPAVGAGTAHPAVGAGIARAAVSVGTARAAVGAGTVVKTDRGDAGDVLNVVHAYFSAADARDWDTYRRLPADHVEVDFGGVNDGSGGLIAADDMLRSARELLGPVHLTQHMISSEVVAVVGEEATVSFYEEALHHHPALGDDPAVNTWILYGRGEHRLRLVGGNWRVVGARLVPIHHVGNGDLLADVARSGTARNAV
jgi:hypothetical protein